MLISQSKIDELKQLGEQKVVLKITGINGLGFPFETSGRITRDDKMNVAVYDECIYLEFGNDKCSYAPQRTDTFAPFIIDYDKKRMGEDVLIVEKITLPNGEVIFENPDFAKYREDANQNAIDYDKKLKKEGRELVELDPVTAKLPAMIGKLIIVDGVKRGILVNFLRAANNGSAIVEVLDGPGRSNTFINEQTRLSTMDLAGKKYLVEVNGKTQEECEKISEIFETRKKNILEAERERKAAANVPGGPQ